MDGNDGAQTTRSLAEKRDMLVTVEILMLEHAHLELAHAETSSAIPMPAGVALAWSLARRQP
jgi:hypothetical protein